MSSLSELQPSGGAGGGSVELVASGALSNGDKVVVNSDGTVSVVQLVENSTSQSQAIGTKVVFDSTAVEYTASTYDSVNNKVVIAYSDVSNSDYGTAVVGTVSENTISFGTPVVFRSSSTSTIGCVYDSNSGKIVIGCIAGAIVGTVSGTSISFGSLVSFGSVYNDDMPMVFDSANNKVIIAYAGSSGLQAIVGTVSGTSISFGSPTVFSSAYINQYNLALAYDANAQKVVAAYANADGYGTAVVGTVSGTSISFGTATVFLSDTIYFISAAYHADAQKIVICYQNHNSSRHGYGIVGTVSGTTISFGTGSAFYYQLVSGTTTQYDSSVNKIVTAFRHNSGIGFARGTVSGTSISFQYSTQSHNTDWISSTFDSTNNRFVFSFEDRENSNYGSSIVYRANGTVVTNDPNLTSTNYIGIADADYPDTATANIQIKGSVNESQTGLTAGEKYYVQTDGTLSTTPDDPSVYAGKAVSSTKLIVKG